MPKLKSHSGAKKRVWRSGAGKWLLRRNSRNHLLLQKARRQKRLRRTLAVSSRERRLFPPLVPYL